MLIYIIYPEQCTGEGAGLAKRYEQRTVYLALWVNEDATEQKYQAAHREDKCCYELQIVIHFFRIFLQIYTKKEAFSKFFPHFCYVWRKKPGFHPFFR